VEVEQLGYENLVRLRALHRVFTAHLGLCHGFEFSEAGDVLLGHAQLVVVDECLLLATYVIVSLWLASSDEGVCEYRNTLQGQE